LNFIDIAARRPDSRRKTRGQAIKGGVFSSLPNKHGQQREQTLIFKVKIS